MKKNVIHTAFDRYIMPTYTRAPLIFVKGKGMTLTDIHGKKYLDFFPGWGVNNVGHCHPKVISAVRDQIGKLIHLPNNFYHPQQAKLAKEIIRRAFKGKVFFCNSGAESCEAAIKFARAYGQKTGRYEILTMEKSFHGRTLGAMSATGQMKYKKDFGPLPDGFVTVPFNDFNAVQNAVTSKTVAVMLELIQGEGGIHIARKEYVEQLRKFCDDKDILLIFDEVQTGIGRTGKIFAFKHYGIEPDLMVLAKALGGGLPIGALVAQEKIADTFQPGMHASTFGGNPLVCKAALGVFKAIDSDKMLSNCVDMGQYLTSRLNVLEEKFDCLTDIRGLGLMIGVELTIEGKTLTDECLKEGLIINCTQGNVLRFMPALNVTAKQIDKAVFIFEKVLLKVTS